MFVSPLRPIRAGSEARVRPLKGGRRSRGGGLVRPGRGRVRRRWRGRGGGGRGGFVALQAGAALEERGERLHARSRRRFGGGGGGVVGDDDAAEALHADESPVRQSPAEVAVRQESRGVRKWQQPLLLTLFQRRLALALTRRFVVLRPGEVGHLREDGREKMKRKHQISHILRVQPVEERRAYQRLRGRPEHVRAPSPGVAHQHVFRGHGGDEQLPGGEQTATLRFEQAVFERHHRLHPRAPRVERALRSGGHHPTVFHRLKRG